jgi:hypothetical protein
MLREADVRNKSRRGQEPLSPVRLLALVLAILALAVLVVSASRPGDAGPAAPPTSAETGAAIIRAAVILFAIGEVGVLGLIVWALWPAGERSRIRTRQGNLAIAIATFLQGAALLVLLFFYRYYQAKAGGPNGALFRIFRPPSPLPAIADGRTSLGAGKEWVTVLLVVAALAIAAGFAFRGVRFRRRPPALAGLAGQLREAAEEGLEELASDPDPRRAVIAAYARMERALAGIGLPRARHEATLEYLDRLLTLLGAGGSAARRLTDLFQLAKFSDHEIDAAMQREAIQALSELRDDLREREVDNEGKPRAVPA